MKLMHIALLVGLVASMAACQSRSIPPQPAPAEAPPAAKIAAAPDYPIKARAEAAPTADEGGFAVSMQRSGCFGRCPQYLVTVHADGRVEFVGERYVNAMGRHQKRIDAAQAARLLAPARALFGSLKDFTPEQPACRPYATDHASIVLGYAEGQQRRTLRHYLGCANAPAVLTDFEQLLDEVADVAEWVSQRPER